MARVGFILSGCGYLDGSEIHEAVVSLLALEESGAKVRALAPRKSQRKVVDHFRGDDVVDTRNVFTESARLVRGEIEHVGDVAASDFDALVLPGGFGAALNLSDFAEKGADMTVDPDVEQLLRAVHGEGKPIGALCIAPVLLAKLFGHRKARITIGNDKEIAATLESFGAQHVDCGTDECVVDEPNRFVTTPAYMLAGRVAEIHPGVRKTVEKVLEFSNNT